MQRIFLKKVLGTKVDFYIPTLLISSERKFKWTRPGRYIIKCWICFSVYGTLFPKSSHEFLGQLCACGWWVYLYICFIMILFKIFCRFWLCLIPRLLNFLHNQRALPIIWKMQAMCFWSDGMIIIIKCRRASWRKRPCNGLLPEYTIANLVSRHLRGSLLFWHELTQKKGKRVRCYP